MALSLSLDDILIAIYNIVQFRRSCVSSATNALHNPVALSSCFTGLERIQDVFSVALVGTRVGEAFLPPGWLQDIDDDDWQLLRQEVQEHLQLRYFTSIAPHLQSAWDHTRSLNPSLMREYTRLHYHETMYGLIADELRKSRDDWKSLAFCLAHSVSIFSARAPGRPPAQPSGPAPQGPVDPNNLPANYAIKRGPKSQPGTTRPTVAALAPAPPTVPATAPATPVPATAASPGAAALSASRPRNTPNDPNYECPRCGARGQHFAGDCAATTGVRRPPRQCQFAPCHHGEDGGYHWIQDCPQNIYRRR